MTEFVTRLTRRAPLVEQELLTLRSTWVHSILNFMCMFCKSLFVFLSFSFWPLCCLSFSDIRILITSLVSSNSSSAYKYVRFVLFMLFVFICPSWSRETIFISCTLRFVMSKDSIILAFTEGSKCIIGYYQVRYWFQVLLAEKKKCKCYVIWGLQPSL